MPQADTDIAAAARRVAEDVNLGFYRPLIDLHADLLALLPVLDAVGAEPGEDRVERLWDVVEAYADMPSGTWTQGGCVELHGTLRRLVKARAAIALADAERAAEAASDFAKGCAEIDRRAEEISARVTKRREEFRAAVREPKGRFKL